MEDPKTFSAPITAFNNSSPSIDEEPKGASLQDAHSGSDSEMGEIDEKQRLDLCQRDDLNDGTKFGQMGKKTQEGHRDGNAQNLDSDRVDKLEARVDMLEAGLKGNDLEANITRSSNTSNTNPEKGNEAVDSNIVDWDGPDDPKNPMNWPAWKVKAHIFLISAITFIR